MTRQKYTIERKKLERELRQRVREIKAASDEEMRPHREEFTRAIAHIVAEYEAAMQAYHEAERRHSEQIKPFQAILQERKRPIHNKKLHEEASA